MSDINILVPDLPESVADATVAVWHKKIGDHVKQNDILVEIETDKIMLEIPAQHTGILKEILEKEGSIVTSKQLLGRLLCKKIHDDMEKDIVNIHHDQEIQTSSQLSSRSIQEESDNDISGFAIVKESSDNKDLFDQSFNNNQMHHNIAQQKSVSKKNDFFVKGRDETRVPMTRLRKKIAERLVNVKQNTAMLTTFNEVDMTSIMNLRTKYAKIFEQRHGVRLGFMSFFVKAVFEALKLFPEINASIDGEEIVYYNYFDISIAVSTDRGLVTPVLRNVDNMSIVDIEKQIKCMSMKGRDGKLKVEELDGGNFTITNGGIFGSLMSTPIINPPQSAILGMHAIKERPVVIDQQIVILPMMYLALSYDHRLIDGKDSISCLITIKDMLEDPIRFLLEI
ncbi:dihydrolipoyllysine-residue succinyltransferase [Blochmannia endosymbiont of Camponotus (Colobopsis) obliquus]|uniref:dihydrolipoyllysine-residue succinyltransferase n=1 Tax=Blochmannia endosymbiont of Camponotus (Colobopsis) obliquus TaxID=1505597 RepID=UPI00061A7312|nr:dihydrolipoyllysine-residue succinyltransferase [Blochmannia endosymbiont of Camponotus (Colobopsis) obliquus]AKC60496.1 Dihydrolipoyllysine-residue succinyltransferase component of 2-oxoglutarate dehydrogenase complex [Blochmannia endosymbiont of Camponotus (Colobopsis) obliquus]